MLMQIDYAKTKGFSTWHDISEIEIHTEFHRPLPKMKGGVAFGHAPQNVVGAAEGHPHHILGDPFIFGRGL